MIYKELTTMELNSLTSEERRRYLNQVNQVNQEKEIREWLVKSSKEKKQDIFSNYKFIINKRGIEGITLEEAIHFAIKNKPNEKSNYVTPLVKQYAERLKNEKFTFFWKTSSPFSQWYKSLFTATTCLIEGLGSSKEYELKRKDILGDNLPLENQEYSSAEQFMMYHKAIIFLDIESAKKIMAINNVRKIKELGRSVLNFDETIWKYYRSKIVLEGNLAKFEQNQKLKEILLKTQGTTLVEASPYDNIWGIGLSADNTKAQSRDTWKGLNLLGEILTKIRVDLMGGY